MVLSDEKKIRIILKRKDEVRKLSGEVLGILSRLKNVHGKTDEEWKKSFELTDGENLRVRKKLNQIISNLSIIAGFCDQNSQEYVQRFAVIISGIGRGTYGRINCLDKYILTRFCTMANTLMVDFNKRPWRIAEVELGFLDRLKARIQVRK